MNKHYTTEPDDWVVSIKKKFKFSACALTKWDASEFVNELEGLANEQWLPMSDAPSDKEVVVELVQHVGISPRKYRYNGGSCWIDIETGFSPYITQFYGWRYPKDGQ